jgi:hypothetical protein
MNGRIYDPKLHRFLQLDNYVQDPSNTQNYNRYAYCWNNPLRYADYNGEWIHLVAGALVGGVFNWVSNGCQFNATGLSYFGTGAASGFVTAATGNPFAGAAILGAGNSAINQLSTTGKIDPFTLVKDVIQSMVITGLTMGILRGVSDIFTKVVRPPISAIS